ncbi:MAG: N-acetylmuramoyl-L-alanine amidase, partial [Verrucomicrobiota bacterium]
MNFDSGQDGWVATTGFAVVTAATPTSPSPGTTSSPGPVQSSSTVTLSWGASTGATYYDLGVVDVATGSFVVNTTTTSPSYTATLTAGKTYRWNVAAGNSAGLSTYTTVRYFQTPTVVVPPGTPTSPSPGLTSSPGTLLTSSTVTLSWGAVSGATYYDLGVVDVATGAFVVNTTTTVASYTATLTAGKQYRWNVAAGNTAGLSSYTTVRYFQTPTVVVPPGTPTSPSPGLTSSPGTLLTSSTVTLSWGAVSGATYYDLGVVDVATGAFVVNTTTTVASYTATLTAGKQYRWNVAAGNTAGLSSYTTVRYFQTPQSGGTQGEPASLGVLWDPAYSGNYGPRLAGEVIDTIVIHTSEGRESNPSMTYQQSYAGAISWFKNPGSGVSAHYCISPSGEITQLVELADKAYHATYYNSRSIGIEMGGFANDSGTWNPQNLAALENLVAYLVTKPGHNIPIVHPVGDACSYPSTEYTETGLVGHSQIQPSPCYPKTVGGITYSQKSDPGTYFPWATFVQEVQAKVGAPLRYTLALTPSPSGGGSVTPSPAPGADGKYASGAVVQLTANANTAAGYSFSAWSGDASGSGNPVNVT